MIKIEKGKAPEFLSSEKVEIARERMRTFYASNREQKRYLFPFNKEIDIKLKEDLHKIFYGKCGYCETIIESPEKGVIDRYRPHNGVRDKDGYNQDLYWWLTFEWDNLIYSCKECNQYKANYFPIQGVRALKVKDNLDQEKRLLLNPCVDDPQEHFYYNHDGHIQIKTREGEQTVDLLRLNDRTDLIEGRKKARKEIITILEKINKNGVRSIDKNEISYLQRILEYDNDSTAFFGYKKWVLLNELGDNFLLDLEFNIKNHDREWLNDRDQNNKILIKNEDKRYLANDYFPIEYIHIKNFKSIENLKIEFKEDELNNKSWLILLGENGVGKSSILQAIAVGLNANAKIITSTLIKSLIKKRKQKAEIEIKERNSSNIIRTILTRKDNTIKQEGSFNSYLMGYGSLRLSVEEVDSESIKIQDTNNVSYENLFQPIKPLNDITKWLKSIYRKDPVFFERVAYSIKQLLPHDFSCNELTIKDNDIMFKKSEELFSELSDGFKSTIILAVDIMMKLSDAQSDMDKMTGIILIDELGNQLHPRWQMSIVKQLRTVFPNINFIISTHHPLCLRGAKRDEILLLKNIEGEVIGIRQLPDPSTLRVDQILASEFFGLSSLVDPETEAYFNRYYELLAKDEKDSVEDEEEITRLRDKLRDKQQLGISLREELMYSVIDKLLAKEIAYNKNPLDRENLKREVINRVKDIWTNLNLDYYDND